MKYVRESSRQPPFEYIFKSICCVGGGNRVKSEEAKAALKNSPKLTKLEKLKVF